VIKEIIIIVGADFMAIGKSVPMFIRGRYWVNFEREKKRKLRDIKTIKWC
jgi:hypothetical protein